MSSPLPHSRRDAPPPPAARGLRWLALLLCLATAGCCSSGSSAPSEETITVLVQEEIKHLDPRFALSAYSVKASHLIHASLVSVENARSEPRLQLASAWSQPTPLVYELTLRPGIRFHDGSPLTARDVVWTYESIRDPALGSPYSGMFDKLERVEALDDLRVRFVLKEPHAPFLTDLVMGIVPEALTRPTGHFEGRTVGAGPYEVVEFNGSDRLVLRRFEQGFGPRPKVGRVVLKTIRDANTRLLALMGGSGDLAQNGINPLLLDALRAKPELAVDTSPSISYSYLGFNLRDPILSRLKVRRAIAHAVDRGRIIRSKFKGTAQPATGLLAPGHWAYCRDVPRYPHDPARARQLLDDAGLPDPDGPGPEPRFTLTYKTTTNRFRRSLAKVLAQQLSEVGIAVEVKSFEWGTLFTDIKSGNFQLYSLQWPSVVEPDLYHWIFHSEMIPTPENRGRGANRNRYINPEVDALIEAGRKASSRKQRIGIYARIQKLLARDLPYLSLWHEENIVVRRKQLRGYRSLPNARFGGLVDAYFAEDAGAEAEASP